VRVLTTTVTRTPREASSSARKEVAMAVPAVFSGGYSFVRRRTFIV
jgi:hypothetical protein